jgi:DNA replication protein DnaC
MILLSRASWRKVKRVFWFLADWRKPKNTLAPACHQLDPACHPAADLVTRLEKAQKQYTLDRFLDQLERTDLLICDELGYVSLSRGGVELLFRVFADRYERGSMLITTNLPFGEWNQIFQGERMTAALLDRLIHRCHIFEMNGESYRFRESMKSKKNRKVDQN